MTGVKFPTPDEIQRKARAYENKGYDAAVAWNAARADLMHDELARISILLSEFRRLIGARID